MSPKFIISHLDEQSGPYDEAELKGKWVKGEILPIDYVYDEAKSDWVLLAERFPWASSKAETETPPPLKEITMVRKPVPSVEAKPMSESSYNKQTQLTQIHMQSELQTQTQIPIPPLAPVSAPAPAPTPIIIAAPAPAPKLPEVKAEAPKAPAPEATTKVTAATPAPTPAAAVQPAKVKLTDGQGEVYLSPLQPGNVQLVLQDQSAGNLKLETPLKIHVKPAEPVAIEWSLVQTQTVGQDLEVHIQALDGSGKPCKHYDDKFTIRVNGGDNKQIPVDMRDGQALIKIQHTKAETWRMTFHYNGTRVLKMPEDRQLEWQPGPATKLILDGPQEYVAGHPLKVHVRAVDNFGNLAKTFQGTVVLEVKAS